MPIEFKKNNSNCQTHQWFVVELCIGNSGLLTPLYGITNSPFCNLGLAIVLSNELDQLSKRGHNLKLTLNSGCFTGLGRNSNPMIWHLSYLNVTHICVCLKESWLAVLPLLAKEGVVMLCLQNWKVWNQLHSGIQVFCRSWKFHLLGGIFLPFFPPFKFCKGKKKMHLA